MGTPCGGQATAMGALPPACLQLSAGGGAAGWGGPAAANAPYVVTAAI